MPVDDLKMWPRSRRRAVFCLHWKSAQLDDGNNIGTAKFLHAINTVAELTCSNPAACIGSRESESRSNVPIDQKDQITALPRRPWLFVEIGLPILLMNTRVELIHFGKRM